MACFWSTPWRSGDARDALRMVRDSLDLEVLKNIQSTFKQLKSQREAAGQGRGGKAGKKEERSWLPVLHLHWSLPFGL